METNVVKYREFIESLAHNFGEYNHLMEGKFRGLCQENQVTLERKKKETQRLLREEYAQRIETYETEIRGLRAVTADFDGLKASHTELSSEHSELLMEYNALQSAPSTQEMAGQDAATESIISEDEERVMSLKGKMDSLDTKMNTLKFTPARYYVDTRGGVPDSGRLLDCI